MQSTVYNNIKGPGHLAALPFDLEKWKAVSKKMAGYIMFHVAKYLTYVIKSSNRKKIEKEKHYHHLW